MASYKSTGVNMAAFGDKPAKKSKYLNKKTMVGDLKFDSKKEAERWIELLAMESRGEIIELRRQARIPFVVNGKKVTTYIADFVYYLNGACGANWVVEDVKSEYTRKMPVYRIKYKLFEAIYGYKIKETL